MAPGPAGAATTQVGTPTLTLLFKNRAVDLGQCCLDLRPALSRHCQKRSTDRSSLVSGEVQRRLQPGNPVSCCHELCERGEPALQRQCLGDAALTLVVVELHA